ncbi:MAG: hypothetical protein ACOYNF_18120 [Rhodoferax sp.]
MIADDINKRCGDTVNISDSPNDRVHFHVYFVDGLFEEVTGDHWTSLKRVFVVVCKGCELDLRMHRLNGSYGSSAVRHLAIS